MNKNRLITIDILRVLAAMAIVMVHTSSQAYYKMELIGYPHWLVTSTLGWMGMWGTPVFIMISGYLLLNSEKEGVEFYRKRISRMAIPWLFWNIAYYGWSNLVTNEKHNFWYQLQGTGTYYHLYFLNVLIGLYAVTPVLKKYLIGKHLWKWTIGWVVLTYIYQVGIVFLGWRKMDNILVWFLPYVGYYLAGYLIGKLKQWDRPLARILIATGLLVMGIVATLKIVFVYSSVQQGTILLHRLSWIVALVAIIIFRTVLKLSVRNEKIIRLVQILAPLTMGIYFIHPMWLDVFKKWPWFAGLTTTNTGIWFGSMWLGTILLSIVSVWLLRKVPIVKNVV